MAVSDPLGAAAGEGPAAGVASCSFRRVPFAELTAPAFGALCRLTGLLSGELLTRAAARRLASPSEMVRTGRVHVDAGDDSSDLQIPLGDSGWSGEAAAGELCAMPSGLGLRGTLLLDAGVSAGLFEQQMHLCDMALSNANLDVDRTLPLAHCTAPKWTGGASGTSIGIGGGIGGGEGSMSGDSAIVQSVRSSCCGCGCGCGCGCDCGGGNGSGRIVLCEASLAHEELLAGGAIGGGSGGGGGGCGGARPSWRSCSLSWPRKLKLGAAIERTCRTRLRAHDNELNNNFYYVHTYEYIQYELRVIDMVV